MNDRKVFDFIVKEEIDIVAEGESIGVGERFVFSNGKVRMLRGMESLLGEVER